MFQFQHLCFVAHTSCAWWMGRFLCVCVYIQTVCFILILGDRVLFGALVLFFSYSVSFPLDWSGRFGATFVLAFVISFCVFSRTRCLLHLNIVAHNLHVVFCQFYACSLCCAAQPRNLCGFSAFVFGVLLFYLLPVMYSLRSNDAVRFFVHRYCVNTFCVTICTPKTIKMHSSQFGNVVATTDLDRCEQARQHHRSTHSRAVI